MVQKSEVNGTAGYSHVCKGTFTGGDLTRHMEQVLLIFPLLSPTRATIRNCGPMPSFKQLLGAPGETHAIPLHAVWLVPQPEFPTISCLLPPLAHAS